VDRCAGHVCGANGLDVGARISHPGAVPWDLSSSARTFYRATDLLPTSRA